MWIDDPLSEAKDSKSKVYLAVGSTSNVTDVSLARRTAEHNARAALTAQFRVDVTELVKIYQGHISSGERGGEEQLLNVAQETFTNMELTGSVPIKYYYDENEKTQYVLIKLDVEGFKESIKGLKELKEDIKNSIIEDANSSFEELQQRRKESK